MSASVLPPNKVNASSVDIGSGSSHVAGVDAAAGPAAIITVPRIVPRIVARKAARREEVFMVSMVTTRNLEGWWTSSLLTA